MDNDNKGTSTMTVITGNELFLVKKRDGSTEQVSIRLVRIAEMDGYLMRYEDLVELVCFVVGKDAAWTDSLDEDSFYELNRRVRAVNDPRFDRWVLEKAATVGTKMKALLSRLRG